MCLGGKRETGNELYGIQSIEAICGMGRERERVFKGWEERERVFTGM